MLSRIKTVLFLLACTFAHSSDEIQRFSKASSLSRMEADGTFPNETENRCVFGKEATLENEHQNLVGLRVNEDLAICIMITKDKRPKQISDAQLKLSKLWLESKINEINIDVLQEGDRKRLENDN